GRTAATDFSQETLISLVCRNVIRNSWILLIGEVLIDWSPAIEDSHAVPIEVVSFTAETCVNDTIVDVRTELTH
ncbi:hypothetical protein, partial [Burkholderia ubonensis]